MTSPLSPTPTRTSRAGRDLRAAIAVALALVAVVVASLVVEKVAFVVVVAALLLIALGELTGALGRAGIKVPVVPVALGSVGMIFGAYFGGVAVLAVALALTAVITMVWRLAGGSAGFVRDASAGVLCAVYVSLMAGFAVLLLRPEDGVARVVTFIAVTVASDIGGYAVGAFFGRHPMAPTISPKKSWEGFAGSAVGCLLVGTLLVLYALDGPWWAGVLLGAAAVVAATAGDLLESVIKRDLGIKDMGALLPGHGGLMDRVDSLLATAAVVWLILDVFVPVVS